MKEIARSRFTYYSLARENLKKKHHMMLNVLLIISLIFTTSLAGFLISDILSFGSNSTYKESLIGQGFQETEKGIQAMTGWNKNDLNNAIKNSIDELQKGLNGSTSANSGGRSFLAPNMPEGAKDNLSSIKKPNNQTKALVPSNPSRTANSARSGLSSGGDVSSGIKPSSGSPGESDNKKSKINHGSSSSSSSSGSSKDNKSHANLTQTISPQINRTMVNQSQINQSQFNISRSNEMKMGNSSNIGAGISLPPGLLKDDKKIRLDPKNQQTPQVRMEFKTDSTKKSDTEKRQNLEMISSASNKDISLGPDHSKSNQAENKNIAAESSKDSIKKSTPKVPEKKTGNVQTSKVTSSSKSIKKVQNARDQQKANRNKLIDNMKKQKAQSRAKSARK